MIRSWRILGLPALLATALTAGQALSTEGPQTDSEKLDQIQKEMKNVVESIKAMGSDLKTTITQTQKSKADIDELKKQLDDLKKEVDRLRSGQSTVIAKSPPGPSGTVVLVNSYPTEVSVVLNQTVYRLRPGETREVSVAAGPFTYRVIQVQPAFQNRELAANGTYTITVH